MESNETVNERRARENAKRIAAHQRATARTPVPTRDSVMVPSLDLHARKQAEDDARIESHRREQARDLLRRKLMREPTEAEVEAAVQR